MIETIKNIYDKLEDFESKEIFQKRIELIFDRNERKYSEWIINRTNQFYIPELDEFEIEQNSKKYVIFGAGVDGRNSLKIIEKSNRKVIGFIDNNKNLHGKIIDNIMVFSPKELLDKLSDCIVIICSRNYLIDIYIQLLKMDFPRKNIFLPKNKFILGFMGNQYFDFLNIEDDEVFIDAGAWHGETALEFTKNCENYKKIYSFEPDDACWNSYERNIKQSKKCNITLIKKGSWSKQTKLSFQGTGVGNSCISNGEETSIQVDSIDNILSGEKVTFIKMDVEGAELESLIGAKNSILEFKPKLAICVYHKPDDIWKIPQYILSLNSEYKIAYRHYSTCTYETVLYAY